MMNCAHKNIANMDHTKGYPPDMRPITIRMCMVCGAHWYGAAGHVKEYRKSEWDKWINAAFDEVAE